MSFVLAIILIYLTFFLVATLILLALVPDPMTAPKDDLPDLESLETTLETEVDPGTMRPYAVNVL